MKGHVRERPSRRTKGRRKTSERTFQLIVEGKSSDPLQRRQYSRTVRGTRLEADAALRAFIAELETGSDAVTKKGELVAAYLQRWLDHVGGRVSARTLDSYRDAVELHIAPHIGNMGMSDVRPLHVVKFLDTLKRSGRKTKKGGALSATSVNYVRGRLSAAFDQAVKWRIVPSNPCDAVDPLRRETVEMRTLDARELQRLFDAAPGTRLYEPIVLAGMTGMRKGEILALRWVDLDFEALTISIERTLLPDRSLAPPKTARSRRRIAMPATVAAVLQRHKAAQNAIILRLGPAYNRDGFVFVDEFGSLWKPNSTGTLFGGIVRRVALGKLRFHDLRHTAASLMIAAGVPITVVAATLGHANTSTTLSVYAHLVKGAETTAAIAMEDALKGAATGR